MRLILLSGGSGKRLWPLSNDARSKQFLKLLNDGTNNQESMVQRVWRQLESVGLDRVSIVATSGNQVDMLQNQLGADVKLVIEPERRDTYPAIALASTYLYSEDNVGLDEIIVVMPVDPYVEVDFFHCVRELESIIANEDADLVLLGVKPTYPSAKYGYIVPYRGQNDLRIQKVSHFQEKPLEEQAAELITQQALWNCGVFAFKLGYMISYLNELHLSANYLDLRADYRSLTKTSFDYEIVEKSRKILAVKYEKGWKDLGTWNVLTEEISDSISGKGMKDEDSHNTHIINELDIPIVVMGIPNAVIAASPDGILLSDKDSSTRLKEMTGIITQRPMYEERRWGWYRVLDYTKYDQGQEVLTKRICVKAGKNLSYQFHHKRKEVWTFLSGTGEYVLEGQRNNVNAGEVLQIDMGIAHGLKATTDLEFIEVQVGSELIEEDIFRVFMHWEEILNYIEKKD
jgi:mannose-1-phosphate guanylyltransferase